MARELPDAAVRTLPNELSSARNGNELNPRKIVLQSPHGLVQIAVSTMLGLGGGRTFLRREHCRYGTRDFALIQKDAGEGHKES
jgi:hypothetical protein